LSVSAQLSDWLRRLSILHQFLCNTSKFSHLLSNLSFHYQLRERDHISALETSEPLSRVYYHQDWLCVKWLGTVCWMERYEMLLAATDLSITLHFWFFSLWCLMIVNGWLLW